MGIDAIVSPTPPPAGPAATRHMPGESAPRQRRAVFLDRDGVINQVFVRDGKPYAPMALEEFSIYADVPAAIERLKQAGYLTIVVTNQPDVARGKVPRETIDALHARMHELLPIDDCLVCPHDDGECQCRKPLPGMLLEASERHGIDLHRSVMVGDRWRDVDAGRNAGCQTVFIDRGYREQLPEHPPHHVCSSLGAAVAWILAEHRA